MITMKQFVTDNRIRMTSEIVNDNPNMSNRTWASTASHYKCVLKHDGRQMTLFFSMGSGHAGPPDIEGVLDCLASDSSTVDNCSGYDDWCGEFGYNAHGGEYRKTYDICVRQADKLRTFLGGELYEQLLYNAERE